MITSLSLLMPKLRAALQRKRINSTIVILGLILGSCEAFAQEEGGRPDANEQGSETDQASAAELPAFATGGQIPPISPVAEGNDPAYTGDPNYILESEQEDEQEAATDNKGIVGPNKRPRLFVNPLARIAATTIVSPSVKIEAFAASGFGVFHLESDPFGVRSANALGGLTSTIDFGLVNANFAYEHRQAYAERFGNLNAIGDKVGASFNRTFTLPIPKLVLTPAWIVSTENVDPYRESTVLMDGSISLTYRVSERFQTSLGGGETDLNLYGNPQLRRNRTMKVTSGLSYKLSDRLNMTVGIRATDIRLYGLAGFRTDRSVSPLIIGTYAVSRLFTIACAADYDRKLSNIYGIATYKFNVAPSLSLTLPL